MEKIDKFKKMIKDNFKKYKGNNLKIIAIVLYLFREKKEHRCEIFDKHKKEEDMWTGFYEEDIQDGETIEGLLESQL